MAKHRFHTYMDENNEELEFTVFIIHGHSEEWRNVERFIKDDLEFNAVILKESFSGKVLFNKFRDTLWNQADCVVAIMTPDDKLNDGSFRSRQNVIYELGYAQAMYDSYYDEDDEEEFERAIIIKERSIDFREISDLMGVECLEYNAPNINTTFHQLEKALKRIYNDLKEA
ncbi:MAG: TIR domain-containing protein [Chitinophagaceae bacterium]